MTRQRVIDTARNLVASKKKPRAAKLQVPVGVWKQGMYCIEIPQIRMDKDAAMPRIWSRTQKEADRLAETAIKAFEKSVKIKSQAEQNEDSWELRKKANG